MTTWAGRRKVAAVALATAAMVVGAGTVGVPPSGALEPAVDTLPSADPIDNTPRVQDGQVNAIVRSGDRVFVGGSFTSVQNGTGSLIQARNRLFSYDHRTGQVDSWNPDIGGSVEALAISPDGRWLYAGGAFSTAGGSTALRVERWDTTTGQRDATFDARASAVVNDLQLRGGVLYLAGNFTTVNDVGRRGLAAVNATTGALLALDQQVGDPWTAGSTAGIRKIDVTANGDRLVAVGNFRSLGGANRPQIAVVRLNGQGGGQVDAQWRTGRYGVACNAVFDTYMRDVGISPDGSYIAVSTTGSWRGADTLCDTAARFELTATGNDIQPTWVNHTGGDTLIGLAVTRAAVYVGGHQRWSNNSTPPRGDSAGVGAVSREGIMALDPVSGVPLRWNPGRERGVGVFEITASADALFIGHDTRLVAGEFRPRLSAFPMTGARNVSPEPIGLPTTLYQGRTNGTLISAQLGPAGVSGIANAPTLGLPWAQLRGAFVQHGQLYAWNMNGAFTRRPFNGGSAGQPVNLIGSAGYVVGPPQQLTNVRAAAFADGRLYYLRNGDSRLWWRWFSLESGIAGSHQFVANGGNWSSVTGIEIAGGRLYAARNDGSLRSHGVFFGAVDSASTVVAGGGNWSGGTDLFFQSDVIAPTAPGQPSATSLQPGQATVTWAAAQDDRAATLTYTLLRDGNPVVDLTGGTSGTLSFTETGLAPGSVHTWSVRASDGINTGPLSPPSAPIAIAGAPPPPPPDVAGTTAQPPLGILDEVVVDGRTIRVRGWALDPDTAQPIGIAYGTVIFGQAGIVRVGLTGLPRPDVAATVHPNGADSGFDLAVDVPPGSHTVCVAALDHDGSGSTGGLTNLGCRDVVVK